MIMNWMEKVEQSLQISNHFKPYSIDTVKQNGNNLMRSIQLLVSASLTRKGQMLVQKIPENRASRFVEHDNL